MVIQIIATLTAEELAQLTDMDKRKIIEEKYRKLCPSNTIMYIFKKAPKKGNFHAGDVFCREISDDDKNTED